MANKEKKKMNNNKQIKEIKYVSDEQKEVMHFIFILVVIVVIVGAVYGVSKIFIKDTNDATNENEVTSGTINYDLVTVGNMLNRSDSEYYVAIYSKKDTKAMLYSTVINKYANQPDSLKIYFCNLDSVFNRSFYVGSDKESNPSAKSIDDLAFGDFTFVKIKNGKITEYIENLDSVKKELGV